MTRSILNDILGLKEKNAESLREYLYSVNFTLFDDIYHAYANEEPYYLTMAILFMYSVESPFLIVHSDSERQKEEICKRLNMPEYLKGWIMTLPPEQQVIRNTIVNYLEEFAGAEWRNLNFLRIQLADIEKIITNKQSTDDKGNFAIKDHMAAIRESNRLSILIDKMEKDIKSRDKHLFIEEIKGANKDRNKKPPTKGGSIENSKQIS